jgi:SSS family solute:Na+ symporter/sodium/pantothenate symporter
VNEVPLGPGALSFLGLYIVSMLVIGYIAKRAQRDESLADFYLAGRSLGSFVLLLTLYATQYSGNTVLGYPGEAYRLGFAWIMSVSFMMSIVVAYLPFAPALHRLAKRHGFVTPGDFLDYRFGSPALSHLANAVLVISIANYLLAQFMAMGHVVAGYSANAIPYWVGVVVLVLVIVIYETLGGLRAVAWTDFIQATLLFFGVVGLLIWAAPTPSHWRSLTEWLAANDPTKVAVPDAGLSFRWVSTVVLVGFSGAIYPQAIQRIYAAKSARALKQSLRFMIFMPLVTIVPVVLAGLVGYRRFSGLEGIQADQIMPMLLRDWATQSLLSYGLSVLVLAGALTAIMSTADSVLLSLSSILAKDFLGKTALRNAPEARLTQTGKILSWGITGFLAWLATSPRITLWGLIELKFELLIQVAPAIILGVIWPRLAAGPTLVGLVVGTLMAGTFALTGIQEVAGIQAGLLALGLNLALAVGLSLERGKYDRSTRDGRGAVANLEGTGRDPEVPLEMGRR